MGDNGAGKSTLVRIIAGNFQPSEGEIALEGRPVRFADSADARNHGIEVVHQDLALCDNLTAADNVFLGRELKRRIGPFQLPRLPRHVAPRGRALRRTPVRDAARRQGADDVRRPAPGRRHCPDPAGGIEDRSDGRADGGHQRASGRAGAGPHQAAAATAASPSSSSATACPTSSRSPSAWLSCAAAARWPTSPSPRVLPKKRPA